jgi:hypothetical protein
MKFMESFLANRPKVDGGAVVPGADSAADPGALSGLLGGEELGFGEEAPRGGGFQSLRTALLEAGSVVSASQARNFSAGKLPASPLGAGVQEVPMGTPALEHADHPDPTVELITNEGRIEKVVVTCSCGRRIELDCAY